MRSVTSLASEGRKSPGRRGGLSAFELALVRGQTASPRADAFRRSGGGRDGAGRLETCQHHQPADAGRSPGRCAGEADSCSLRLGLGLTAKELAFDQPGMEDVRIVGTDGERIGQLDRIGADPVGLFDSGTRIVDVVISEVAPHVF